MPGSYCCLKSCGNNSRNKTNSKISYHKFPTKTKLCKKWTNFINTTGQNNFVLKPSSVLCSAHFKPESFERTCLSTAEALNLRKVLIKTAVPELFMTKITLNNPIYLDDNVPSDPVTDPLSNTDQNDMDAIILIDSNLPTT